MSLIRCPECKRKISDKATICPSCGFPQTEVVTPSAPNIWAKLRERIKNINVKKTFKNIISFEWMNRLFDKVSEIPIIGGFLSFLFISCTSLLIFGSVLALIVWFISLLIEIEFYFGVCVAWILFGIFTYLLGFKWDGTKALFWMYIIFTIIGVIVFSNYEYFL